MSLYKSIPHTFRKEGIYYFNRRVPKDVRSSYNKSRISFSSLVGLGPSSSSLNLFPSDNPFVLVKTSYLSHLLSSYKFVRSSLVNGYQVKINLACQNNHIICKPFNYRFLIRCMYNFYKPKKKGTRKLIVHLPIFFSSTAIFFFSFFSWILAF